jgi:hypothetical protein
LPEPQEEPLLEQRIEEWLTGVGAHVIEVGKRFLLGGRATRSVR